MADLLVDCPTGLAGDMLLAACFDLGVPRAVVEEPLASLGLAGAYQLTVEETSSGGLRGLRLQVSASGDRQPHRRWGDLRAQIEAAALAEPLRQRVLRVFAALAAAEARVHGMPEEAVHFHEVGAIDSLVDVVGVCAAITHLAPDRLLCQPPPAGRGSVATAHGVLPVPVPAVLELARQHRLPFRGGEDQPEGELTTPTGLALMAVLADSFAPWPSFAVDGLGVGLGHRQLDRPNLLRLIRSDRAAAAQWQELVLQEAWLDDASPEDVAALAESLRQAGALEVTTTPALMQKGRQGLALAALLWPQDAESLRRIWLARGPTLGVRERRQGRWVLPRRGGHCPSPWGPVRVKQVRRPGGECTVKVEHDELQRLSQSSGQSIDRVRLTVLAEAERFEATEAWRW
jgi:uncharacterized protein (TIGR00299 family) protein